MEDDFYCVESEQFWNSITSEKHEITVRFLDIKCNIWLAVSRKLQHLYFFSNLYNLNCMLFCNFCCDPYNDGICVLCLLCSKEKKVMTVL